MDGSIHPTIGAEPYIIDRRWHMHLFVHSGPERSQALKGICQKSVTLSIKSVKDRQSYPPALSEEVKERRGPIIPPCKGFIPVPKTRSYGSLF